MANLITKRWGPVYGGQTITMPIVGEVTFEKDGSLNVELDGADLDEFLSATDESFGFESSETKEKGSKPGKVTAAAQDRENAEKLDQLTTVELLELAKDAFPDEKPEDIASWTDGKIKKKLLQVMKNQTPK